MQKKSAEDACRRFQDVSPPLVPFRDCLRGESTYAMTTLDVAKGVEKAIQLGWFAFDKFDCQEYDYLYDLDNGDMTWIVPGKFFAFAGPEDYMGCDDDCASPFYCFNVDVLPPTPPLSLPGGL